MIPENDGAQEENTTTPVIHPLISQIDGELEVGEGVVFAESFNGYAKPFRMTSIPPNHEGL